MAKQQLLPAVEAAGADTIILAEATPAEPNWPTSQTAAGSISPGS
jgi:hypothetical protein